MVNLQDFGDPVRFSRITVINGHMFLTSLVITHQPNKNGYESG